MTPPTSAELEALTRKLEQASAQYYGPGDSPLSDVEFDALVEHLREIDPNNQFLAQVGTPGGKVKLDYPMLSLHKVTVNADLGRWWNKVERNRVLVQPKLDGSSLMLTYRTGDLVRATTRGDGEFGEDVTQAVRRMPSVPKSLSQRLNLSVAGEVVLPYAEWEKVDPERRTNPRNVGNGILNRKSNFDQAHHLQFLAFDLVSPLADCCLDPNAHASMPLIALTEGDADERVFDDGVLALMRLQSLGFDVVPWELCHTAGGAHAEIAAIREQRESLPWAIDGAVIKVADLSARASFGVSSGRPNGAVAYKWKSQTTTTVVTGVNLTVGHTGLISPTATLEPVELMGVTISNVLLNNWDEIALLGLDVGDTVEVERAGEIIPKVVRVLRKGHLDRSHYPEPIACPHCGETAARRTNTDGSESSNTYCSNPDCGARAEGRLKRWVKSLNILGIGDELLRGLTVSGVDVKGLYALETHQLRDLPLGAGVVGESRADAIVANIQATRNLPLRKFIGSLGAPFLGVRAATLLIEQYPVLSGLEAWFGPVLLAHGNTGPVIHAWLAERRAEIEELAQVVGVIEAGLDPVAPDPQSQTDPFTFCLTGKFEVPKKDIHARIEAAGHSWLPELRSGVTHLVQADPESVSNKSKKARASGIRVIGLSELDSLLS